MSLTSGREVLPVPYWRRISKNYVLYLFLLPTVAYLAVFHYAPLYGIQIAFKDFNPALGIGGSHWIGLENFQRFFRSYSFGSVLRNTLTLSVYGLVVGFPFPILLALMLNYCPNARMRKIVQNITYAPHFISTVVMVGMLMLFLAPSSGLVNMLLGALGYPKISFMTEARLFPHVYVWSGIWQSTGFSAVIYIAALAGVSPEIHEAAIVDGANKVQRILHVDLPSLMPTIVILLILNMGSVMNVGFEKVYLMQKGGNIQFSEIISTYVYKAGIQKGDYSFSSAIGLFNNAINFTLLLIVNKIAGKLSGSSLW